MPYYAQIDLARVCFAVTQTAGPVTAADMVEVQGLDASLLGSTHNKQLGRWTRSSPTTPARRLAPLAFRRRFTPTERAALEWAAVDKPEQSEQERMGAAALRSSLKDQAQASYIDLDDPDTVAGVQGLEALGLLAEGRAEDILTAEVRDDERP